MTIEYHDGRPLGMLLGAIVPSRRSGGAMRLLPSRWRLDWAARFTPEASGTLYLRVNDSAARLGDNRGTLTIRIAD